ncbi:MAG: ankyrin repeat domain-containing protein [Alphaproteobacteria bacterium]|nr:ankyrin repeat domain-containing protein [Alphaproteobacteria bacterium]
MTPSIMTGSRAYNFNIDTFEADSGNLNLTHSLMHDLAREGDLLSAEVIFEAGAPIDSPNDEGRRPLHEAAASGHADIAAFLLDNGADIEAAVQPFGHTALTLAVQQGHYDVVAYLLKRGASLGCADRLSGAGLLHIAAAKGDAKMAGLLIRAGADVFAEDKRGLTARDAAARAGHTGLEHTLLKVMEHHYKYAVA